MAYVINKSDGTALTTLQDATIDTSTSVTLVGRNYIGYGEIQNENFLFLLENFANESAPARPVEGQVWFDKTLDVLKVYDGAKWVPVGAAELSATAPSNPPTGAFWLKTPYNTLYVWNGSDWQLIGPEVAEGYGVTKSVSGTLLSQDGVTYPVIFTYVNDKVVGITTSVGFTINTSNSVANFNVLRAGYNVAGDSFFQGNLIGVASRATQLDTLRTINGVGFNGTADITITANTTGSLKSGNYIDGNDFNGAGNETWNVDATPANVIGKVVARDSSGNFSAGTVTADLVGDVIGNVNIGSGTSEFNVVRANQFIGPTLSGNALTATELQTARNINGVAFDGTRDITVTADASTLSGIALANNVVSSNLEQVGLLLSLGTRGPINVDGALTLNVTSGLGNITANRELSLIADDGVDTAAAKVIAPDVSVTSGTGANGALVPTTDGDVDLGKTNLKWDNVHANTFIGPLQGNADTATLATTATNIAGGAAGSFAYQTASGTTALLPAGTPGQILKTGGTGGAPSWTNLVLGTPLEIGDYLTGIDFDGTTPTEWSVDATPNNTASKVVARDASGNFSAGTITANLTGNATTATTATNNVLKAGDTMTGFLTLHANPTANLHAATKQYVDDATRGLNVLWAGATTLANVQATYASYPTGTKVAFWNERVYNAPRNGNGGNATVYDRYKETVEKQANGTWITVG